MNRKVGPTGVLRRPSGLVGGLLVGSFLLVALLGPSLAPQDPYHQDLGRMLQGPSAAHILGTDENGADLLSEMLYGARLALIVAGTVVAVSFLFGVALGSVSGYLGGWADEVLMRITDVLMAFPGILLNLAVVALVPRPSVGYLIFALCLNGWVGFARMARAQVLTLKTRPFVTAARAGGISPFRILLGHILPHALPPLVIQASLAFAGVVLTEASLSFLGLGPPYPYSWGALLSQGTSYLWVTQHLALVPGTAIALVVFGFNMLGDGLQDALGVPSKARGG